MARDTRFFRWYRVLPLLAVALVGAASLVMAMTPAALLRRLAYPVEHRDAILASSARHGVEPALACAVIACESGWQADATSPAGAIGLMQVMPDTAETVARLGLVDGAYDPADLTDPETNIEFGCAYLGYLQGALGSREEVVAAYNAGIGTVQTWLSGEAGEVGFPDAISYPETRLYLLRVSEAYDRYRELYDAELNPVA